MNPHTCPLLFIPEVALEKVFSFLTYDEIARDRIVCRKFNEIGSRLLSRGFIQLEKRHGAVYKRVKSLLPRRESERRSHPLSRHCDILQAVETRISMLNMTYMKYMESNLLCFIPGKVLDEMINVLRLVESDFAPPRTHQLLQELRDLSSMAMEHFDEHILPRVKQRKEQMDERRQALLMPANLRPARTAVPVQPSSIEMQKIKRQHKVYKHYIMHLNQNTLKIAEKVKKQASRLKAQSVKMRDQERKIQEQTAKLQEQEAALIDIKKHLDEWDQKYKDLTTELVRARDDILLKTGSTSSSSPIPRVLSPPKCLRSSIRPRISQFLPKNYQTSQSSLDLERKRKSNLLPDIPVKLGRFNNCGEDKDKAKPKESSEGTAPAKSNFSLIIENLIKTPLSNMQSRKRKMSEEIDLK